MLCKKNKIKGSSEKKRRIEYLLSKKNLSFNAT